MSDRNNQIVDANKKPNARKRYLVFKAVADEHFGGLDKSITDYIEGLEEIRRADNQIITNLYNEITELKSFINCEHSYVKAQGLGGGHIFLYCNKCGATKHEG